MTITKSRLVNSLSERIDLPKSKSYQLLETLLEIVMDTLKSGEDVLISGFGKFSVKAKAGRKGRNPVTGKDLRLRARRVVTFQCSSVLKEKMNART